MKIDTLGVQAFIAVADHASFRKAATALRISQTALTRRLQNLEAALGVRLVERTTRSVALTSVGVSFLPQARRLLTELSAALSEVRDIGLAQRGDVCIACIPTAGVRFLPRILREYSARFPRNRIRILDNLSPAVTEAVLRREAEFGVNVSEAHHPDLAQLALLQDRFVLVCRDDHPLAARKKLSWKQLVSQPVIFSGPATANRSLLDLALGAQGLNLHSYCEVQRSSTALGMVAEGVAAAIVPRLAIRDDDCRGIRVIALTEPVVSRSLMLVKRKAATLSPAAQALYDLIRQRAVVPPVS